MRTPDPAKEERGSEKYTMPSWAVRKWLYSDEPQKNYEASAH